MKRKFCLGSLLVFLLGLMAFAVASPMRVAAAAEPVVLEVFNPTGAIEVTETFAPRIDTLHGKTICEISNGAWEDHRTFPLVRELLQRQFPTAKFISYTEFPVGTSKIDNDKVAALVKQKGCQAAIVGNAG